MSSTNKQPISRVGIYCRVWLSIVAFMLVLRCTVFFGPWGDECGLSFTYILCTWPILLVVRFVDGYRFRDYLEQHHREKWKELTGANDDGSFSVKSWFPPKWLTSSDSTGDPVLDQMKKDSTLFVALMFMVFFSNIIMFPLLTYGCAV